MPRFQPGYSPSPDEDRSYVVIGQHPPRSTFDPFDPDLIGALREAYAWIINPYLSTPGSVQYRSRNLDAMTTMMRRAIAKADPEFHP